MKERSKARVLDKVGQHYAVGSHLVVQDDGHDTETTVAVRRVVRDGTEELQIEVRIVKRGEKRNTYAYGTIVCTPEIADQISEACAKVRAPKLEAA